MTSLAPLFLIGSSSFLRCKDNYKCLGEFEFQQFFFCFQSYHDGQLSLLCSISGLPVLSEHHILSSVTENQ